MRSFFGFHAILLYITATLCTADNTTSPFTPWPIEIELRNGIEWRPAHPLKYKLWFPGERQRLEYVSNGVCNLTYQAYLGSQEARNVLETKTQYCHLHFRCILNNMRSEQLADFSAATVVLGLTPTILATIGPTFTEIALLSLHRPLLAILLSVGSPELFLSRITVFDNPSMLVGNLPGALIVPAMDAWIAILASAVQYLLSLGAVANVLHMSWEIGRRAIISWACQYGFHHLLWSVMMLFPHFFAWLGLHYSAKRESTVVKFLKADRHSHDPDSETLLSLLKALVVREFTISSNRKIVTREFDFNSVSFALGTWTTFAGLAHYIWGTAIFAGLQFIEERDAVWILMRYMASGLTCKFIIWFELGGLRRRDPGKTKTNGWIIQE